MFGVVLCAASSSFLKAMRSIYGLVLPPIATRDFGVRGLPSPNQLAFSQLLKKCSFQGFALVAIDGE